MTTNNLILEALKICKAKLDVTSIRFSQNFDIEKQYETLQFTVFYKIGESEEINFTVDVSSLRKDFSMEHLLLQLEIAVLDKKKIEIKTTEIEVKQILPK
jgi:hypothetical protein